LFAGKWLLLRPGSLASPAAFGREGAYHCLQANGTDNTPSVRGPLGHFGIGGGGGLVRHGRLDKVSTLKLREIRHCRFLPDDR
jgi:hypothetical protein